MKAKFSLQQFVYVQNSVNSVLNHQNHDNFQYFGQKAKTKLMFLNHEMCMDHQWNEMNWTLTKEAPQ